MPIAQIRGIPAAGLAALHRGLPFNPITGHIIYVGSTSSGASNDARGDTPLRPKASIEAAFNSSDLSANRGDLIVCLPGHVETVTAAGGLDCDIAGVTVMGLGSGSNRPTINFTTAVGADMDIDAANITMENILFTGGIDALTGPIDVNAADFSMLNCETRDVTGQTTDFIVTDANADRLLIDGWRHIGAAGDGGDSAITIVGGDDIEIKNFNLYGNFDQGAIENVTTAAVRLNIHDGYIWTEGAEDLAIALVATTTGRVGPNIYIRLQDDAANVTECLVGADMQFFQPLAICNADGEVGLNSNITATVDEA